MQPQTETKEIKETKASQAIHLLANINRLGLKAFNSKTKQELIFFILNDTISVVRYEKAALWSISKNTKDPEVKLLGISGYPTVNQQTLYAKNWTESIANIKIPTQSHIVVVNDTKTNNNVPSDLSEVRKFLWLSIIDSDKEIIGLSLERNLGLPWKDDEIELLNFLMQNYNAAWKKFDKKGIQKINLNRASFYIIPIALALSLWFHIPLPISAPCEVVPRTPILITAPLDGIVSEVKVQPGQFVKKDTILFEYDKRAPLQELQAAKNQVSLIQAQLKKDTSLGFQNKKALEQLAVTKEKLNKEKNQLELAKYRASQLDVKSPINGIVIIENPDEWRGNPVHIGEKIMTVSDPTQTKIKIWVPENDNISINEDKKIKVILNVMPEQSFLANLLYINTFSTLDDKQTPSFLAEADWVEQPADIKAGLKGTAILYGNDVSIFYWVIRRPWSYLRTLVGY